MMFIELLVVYSLSEASLTTTSAFAYTQLLLRINDADEAGGQQEGSCIPSGDQASIQNALAGVGAKAMLCPDAVFELDETVYFTADSQQIYTEGFPTDDTRALLRVVGNGVATAVSAEGNDYVSLRNVIIDGNRPQLGLAEGALIREVIGMGPFVGCANPETDTVRSRGAVVTGDTLMGDHMGYGFVVSVVEGFPVPCVGLPDSLGPWEEVHCIIDDYVADGFQVLAWFGFRPDGGFWGFDYPFEPTAVTPEERRSSIPKSFFLSQNYPNPFNPSTTIDYVIPEGDAVTVHLKIYDLRGRLIRTFIEEDKGPGRYAIHWDGRDDRGAKVGSGLYLYRIKAADFTSVRKMTILR